MTPSTPATHLFAVGSVVNIRSKLGNFVGRIHQTTDRFILLIDAAEIVAYSRPRLTPDASADVEPITGVIAINVDHVFDVVNYPHPVPLEARHRSE